MHTAPFRCRSTSGALAGAPATWMPALACLLLLAEPIPLVAQYVAGGGDGFRYSAPEFSLTFRGGLDRPTASSDVYRFTTRNLTLSRNDFASLGLNIDFALHTSRRGEVVFSAGMAGREQASEFRDYIDNADQPIQQRTLLRRTPISVGFRYALTSPGEQLSKLAWVPSRFTPWVGLGGGIMGYKFRQVGDFVDFETLNVFTDKFSTYGWSPMGYGSIGGELSLSARTALVGDLRYTMARAPLRGAFEGFDRIDLSGTAATMGISLRY